MPKIKLSPFTRSVIYAFIFFALGRFILLNLGTAGWWLIGIILVLYYLVNWILFQRKKNAD